MPHDQWRTPKELFDVLDAEFQFDLDAAASEANTLCDKYITAEQDSLKVEWGTDPSIRSVWCNPPYTLIGPFVARAYEQSQKYHMNTVVLIPAYTDPKYWSDWVMKAHEVRFLKGRLAFIDEDGMKKTSARFPSVVVVNQWLKGVTYGKAPNQYTWDWRA
jgi:phage N-6-adenine-methyltransferase